MRRILPCLLALSLPSVASAAPSYWIGYDNISVLINSPSPFVRDSLWSANTGSFSYTGTSHAYALAGGAGVKVNSRTDFLTGIAAQTGFSTNAGSMTDDFIITGPPGVTSVTGTFYFRVQGQILITGGLANSANDGGIFDIYGTVAGLGFWGEMQCRLGSNVGLGSFVGLNQNSVATDVPVSGSFPVGTPFQVMAECFLNIAHYGNNVVSPSSIQSSSRSATDGFVSGIGNSLGYVMALPAGYDLSSISWNVVHNHMVPTLSAPLDTPPAQLALSVASGNPSSGPALLRFALPADAHVDLGIYDVAGRQVRNLASCWRAAGTQSVEWDGRDESGSAVAPGMYLAAIRAGGRWASVRLVRLR